MIVEDSDSSLFGKRLAEARPGEPSAIGRLLGRMDSPMPHTAEAFLDSRLRPKVAPSDIVQISLMEAQTNFAQLEGSTQAELARWLRRIVINNVLSEYRYWQAAKRKGATDQLPLDSRTMIHRDEAIDDPGRLVEDQEQQRRLIEAIEKLSTEQQQVILLRNRHGLSYPELGEHLGDVEFCLQKLNQLWTSEAAADQTERDAPDCGGASDASV